MRFRLGLIAAFILAFPANAGITFDPPDPTAHDSVKLVIDADFWPTQ